MDITKLKVLHPVVADMADAKEVFWLNERADEDRKLEFGMSDIEDAEARLARFAAYIQAAFPETEKSKGIIESPDRKSVV